MGFRRLPVALPDARALAGSILSRSHASVHVPPPGGLSGSPRPNLANAFSNAGDVKLPRPSLAVEVVETVDGVDFRSTPGNTDDAGDGIDLRPPPNRGVEAVVAGDVRLPRLPLDRISSCTVTFGFRRDIVCLTINERKP